MYSAQKVSFDDFQWLVSNQKRYQMIHNLGNICMIAINSNRWQDVHTPLLRLLAQQTETPLLQEAGWSCKRGGYSGLWVTL